MAKIFYYDVGTADADVSSGTTGGTTTYTDTGTAVTNHNLANDQSIGAAMTAFGQNDAIRFDFGSSVSGSIVAVYFGTAEATNVDIYAGSSGTNMIISQAKLVAHTTDFVVGWNIIDLGSSKSGRYWFFVANSSSIEDLREIFIGDSWTFSNRYDLGNSKSKAHGIDISRSYGNVKGTNKRFDELETWNWTWPNIAEADKTNLETFENNIDIVRLKFVYYDETTYWWVSKTNAFNFTELAYQYYSTSCNLIEEIE